MVGRTEWPAVQLPPKRKLLCLAGDLPARWRPVGAAYGAKILGGHLQFQRALARRRHLGGQRPSYTRPPLRLSVSSVRRIFRRHKRPGAPPPAPPRELAGGVGPGDYWKVGEETVALISDLAGLRRRDHVLDVGCGLGRIAWPLSLRLGKHGRYVGFDVALPYVEWCVSVLGLPADRFAFQHISLYNSWYNPSGTILPAEFSFPWQDETFDLVVATSLFTHLLPDALVRYLGEIHRVMAPHARFFASFFLVDEESSRRIVDGSTYPRFADRREWGWVQNAAAPEAGVAVDRGWLLRRMEDASLSVQTIVQGRWRSESGQPCYQDVIVASRRRA